jgi:hypothetical protein
LEKTRKKPNSNTEHIDFFLAELNGMRIEVGREE